MRKRHAARDAYSCAALDLDMIGAGPYLAHLETPLGRSNGRVRFDTRAIFDRALEPFPRRPGDLQAAERVASQVAAPSINSVCVM